MQTYRFYGWQEAGVPAVDRSWPGIDTPLDLYGKLSQIWCAETCAPRLRARWTPENRTLGQCSITAFLVQDLFGGQVYGILRPGGNYHCYNVVDGHVFDLTSEQFGGEILSYRDNHPHGEHTVVHIHVQHTIVPPHDAPHTLEAKPLEQCGAAGPGQAVLNGQLAVNRIGYIHHNKILPATYQYFHQTAVTVRKGGDLLNGVVQRDGKQAVQIRGFQKIQGCTVSHAGQADAPLLT